MAGQRCERCQYACPVSKTIVPLICMKCSREARGGLSEAWPVLHGLSPPRARSFLLMDAEWPRMRCLDSKGRPLLTIPLLSVGYLPNRNVEAYYFALDFTAELLHRGAPCSYEDCYAIPYFQSLWHILLRTWYQMNRDFPEAAQSLEIRTFNFMKRLHERAPVRAEIDIRPYSSHQNKAAWGTLFALLDVVVTLNLSSTMVEWMCSRGISSLNCAKERRIYLERMESPVDKTERDSVVLYLSSYELNGGVMSFEQLYPLRPEMAAAMTTGWQKYTRWSGRRITALSLDCSFPLVLANLTVSYL